jgi:hypothetical protein
VGRDGEGFCASGRRKGWRVCGHNSTVKNWSVPMVAAARMKDVRRLLQEMETNVVVTIPPFLELLLGLDEQCTISRWK